MPAPIQTIDFLNLLRRSALVAPARLETFLQQLPESPALPETPKRLAALAVGAGLLTYFQAQQLLQGKWRGFTLGKYKILERLGSGGMGIVYLCEHKLLARRVAVKVLPVALAKQSWFLETFYREAEAVAALNHPNIVRAHDIDESDGLHFLVMEFVDGTSLQEIVGRHGPMNLLRACHYIAQAAQGLQHAHEVGIVHRDIKPGNLLLDRKGQVKILDMGLAHFFRESKAEIKVADKQVKAIVGTGDYLAPEQVVNSDDVDARADIYSLGATFYFLVTGKPPFEEADMDYQKLLWHLARQPKPVQELRREVPQPLADFLMGMMAKNPWERPRFPKDVVQFLSRWTWKPIPPPPAHEMPRLSQAALPPGEAGRAAFGPSAVPPSSAWSIVQPGATPVQVPSRGAETPRPVEAETVEVMPKAPSPVAIPVPAPGNSSVTLDVEDNGPQNSSLLRECMEVEKQRVGSDSSSKT